ncbi:MAG: hypothetical protein ACYCRD_07485 [Leptospirillum sp.]
MMEKMVLSSRLQKRTRGKDMAGRIVAGGGILALFLLGGCATSPDRTVANHHVLLDDRSTRFYVRTIPVPHGENDLIIVRKVVLDTVHHISFPEFLRQVQPHSVKAHYYLMDYSRSIVEAPDSEAEGEWKHPLFGNPYRYRYTGTIVVLRSEWQVEKARQRKKLEEAIRKEKKKQQVENRLTEGMAPLSSGPDGGKILQEDSRDLTEVLPSGAYIVHPASELIKRGYRFRDGQWEGPPPQPSQ